MAIIIEDDGAGAAATIAGRTPNVTNTPGNTISVPLGTIETNGSGAFVCTAKNGNGHCLFTIDGEYDLTQPGASMRIIGVINLGGLAEGDSGGIGPVLYQDSSNWTCFGLFDLPSFSHEGLDILRADAGYGEGYRFVDGETVPFAVNASTDYTITAVFENISGGVRVTTTVNGNESVYDEMGWEASTLVGFSMRGIGYLLKSFSVETDIPSAAVVKPVPYQYYPMKSTLGTDVEVEFTLVGSGAPEGKFDPSETAYRKTGASGGTTGLLEKVPLGGGIFYLRDSVDTSAEATVANTGVALAAALIGNSNDFGLGASDWNYTANASYPNNKPAVFRLGCLNGANPYEEALSPIHEAGGADDYPTLADTAPPSGSWISLALQDLLDLGDELDDPVDVPLTIIPCAKTGQGTADWLPNNDDPFDDATLFGCFALRVRQHGGVHLVTMGIEIDCYDALETAETVANLTAIGEMIYALFGAKLLIRGPHTVTTGWWSAAQTAKQVAAGAAVASEDWCAGFVDNSALGPPSSAGGGADGLHIYEQAFAQSIADAMAVPMRAALADVIAGAGAGGGGGGGTPSGLPLRRRG